jgi:hypothetical protein
LAFATGDNLRGRVGSTNVRWGWILVAAATEKPPTALRGSVAYEAFSSSHGYGEILDDITAELPHELVWPLSVRTYSTMRRDATVDAILQGYTLQMRRATWQLSGRDCNPGTVALVAQDMDLPVVGSDEAGAARVKGVSWPEHLRSALMTTLTFGHGGYELGAEVVDGTAHLTVLAERPASTIMQIHVDPQSGEFLGVTQDKPRPTGDPQIPSTSMAWYCRGREGISWQGVSLLRSSWAAFLIKREMMRVHAESNRRWGMGVPVAQALPGTDPTPGQMSSAAAMAQSARAGARAGAAMPPGFELRITGLSGSVPDTLAFIQWLDRQMSRAVLMPHIELGQAASGGSGSRALGEAFIDSWTLALEAQAEEAAVVATRQIAARIVAWNKGADEPVPRVIVSGVGSRREVTAESLQLLMSSGALQPDPALEAWIRREYRLPEREAMPKPAPSVQGDTVRDANRPGRARSRPTQRQPDGQLELPIAAAAGDSHTESCGEANLISVCECGCNGTRHGEDRAHSRLGNRKAEQVKNLGGSPRLAAMTDDELATVFARLSAEGNWDGFAAVDGEMARRENASKWVDGDTADDHWHVGGEPTEQDHQVDALLARGYDFVDAYAEVYGKNVDRLRSEERSSTVDKVAGETVDGALRRGYDQLVHEQWLRAETDTRGHLLTKQAQTAGVQAVDLFSGPTARARKWASEDLQRWWADNGRLTFTQYRAQVLGRKRDRRSAELTRLGGNAKDFV